jgi:hypothetical protein
MSRWSYKEDRRFVEIAASSKSLEEIVKRTGQQPKAVRKAAIRLGVTLAKGSTKAKGK